MSSASIAEGQAKPEHQAEHEAQNGVFPGGRRDLGGPGGAPDQEGLIGLQGLRDPELLLLFLQRHVQVRLLAALPFQLRQRVLQLVARADERLRLKRAAIVDVRLRERRCEQRRASGVPVRDDELEHVRITLRRDGGLAEQSQRRHDAVQLGDAESDLRDVRGVRHLRLCAGQRGVIGKWAGGRGAGQRRTEVRAGKENVRRRHVLRGLSQ